MPSTKHHFVYQLFDKSRLVGGEVIRIGKGSVTERSKEAVISYLKARYPDDHTGWAWFEWASDEMSAYAAERLLLDTYKREHAGELPPLNQVGGGGGRRSS